MAKAKISFPDGSVVNLEGTPDEISAVLDNHKRRSGAAAPTKASGRTKKAQANKVTIPALVAELKNEGFFKKPKGLGEIKTRLGELGHHYPLTTLSGAMQTEAKHRQLRRFKEKGKYVYAQ